MVQCRSQVGENFFPSLPPTHLFSTHSCAGTVHGLGQAFPKCHHQCLWLLFHGFASDFYLLQGCSLNPSFFFQPPVCCLHVGASQTQPNLSYSPNSCGTQGMLSLHTPASPRAEYKLCTRQCLPLQTAPLPLPGLREHTHGTGPFGRVRPRNRLPAVWAGNSEAQKPEMSPTTLHLLAPQWPSGLSPGPADALPASHFHGSRGLGQAAPPSSQDRAAPLPTSTPVHFNPPGLGKF